MCNATGYKSSPYVLALIAILDLGLGILRIYIYFSPKSKTDPTSLTDIVRYVFLDQVASPLPNSRQTQAAFALDWISSIVPTLMGAYLIIFAILSLLTLGSCCECIVEKITGNDPKFRKCGPCSPVMCFMCMNKPNHRFISLSCNCPCYRARPQLRFQVRFGLTVFFILLRTIAVILYATDKTVRVYGQQMAAVCGVSLALLLCVMIIDFYHFRVWWYYRPNDVYKPCQLCCNAPKFEPPHRRFLPMPLLGKFRDMTKFGDRPCENSGHASCPNRTLEHIAMFHGYNYKPLRRFNARYDETYIGFHQTEPDLAVSIVKTGFRISEKPPQMLGFGVYFARSFSSTEGKARRKGAYIVAEVTMGKVLFVIRSEHHLVSNSSEWHKQYDTVYYKHENENLDEFCIKDPAQIKQWIVIIDDQRVYDYELDREFADTACHCI